MAMTKPKSSQIEHRGESVQKVIDDITQEDGVLTADPSWTDVPKLKGVNANKQALALANRGEFLLLNSAFVLGSIADLRLYDGNSECVRISDSLTGGFFALRLEDTDGVDDGGLRIVDANGRRWGRIFSGPVSVSWFGMSKAVEDNRPFWQKCVESVYARGGGEIILEPNVIYPFKGTARIASNITLNLNGGGFRRDFTTGVGGSSVMHGYLPEDGDVNHRITVKNGTLDGNGQNYFSGHNIFGTSRCSKLTFEDVDFLNCIDNHAIDFANATDVVVRGCRFLGWALLEGSTRTFAEAIQLDPALVSVGDEGKPIRHVLIENCYCGPNPANSDERFGAWPTFVGNHAVNSSKTIVDDVVIRNNYVVGCTYAAVRPYAWTNVVIEGNTFDGCNRVVLARGGYGTNITGAKYLRFINNLVKTNAGANVIEFEAPDYGVVDEDDANSARYYDEVVITNNTFVDSPSTNFVILQRCRNCVISNNVLKNVRSLISSLQPLTIVHNLVVSGNVITKSYENIINIINRVKRLSITNNIVNDALGRFVFGFNSDSGGYRSDWSIIGNMLTDVGGDSFIGLTQGASSNHKISGNHFSVGTENRVPSGGNLIHTTVGGPVYCTDNFFDPVLLDSGKGIYLNGYFNGFWKGNPNSKIRANPGSVVFNISGGAGASMYVKESGVETNTGWVAK